MNKVSGIMDLSLNRLSDYVQITWPDGKGGTKTIQTTGAMMLMTLQEHLKEWEGFCREANP